jgi:hypothetical protein
MDPLPSSFINHNNGLNNTILSTELDVPQYFSIWRKPAITPCGADGTCSFPDGRMEIASANQYNAMTPVICVIPKGSIKD